MKNLAHSVGLLMVLVGGFLGFIQTLAVVQGVNGDPLLTCIVVIIASIAAVLLGLRLMRGSESDASISSRSSTQIEIDPRRDGWEDQLHEFATSHLSSADKRKADEEYRKQKAASHDPFDHSAG
jgi:hypothetical protein